MRSPAEIAGFAWRRALVGSHREDITARGRCGELQEDPGTEASGRPVPAGLTVPAGRIFQQPGLAHMELFHTGQAGNQQHSRARFAGVAGQQPPDDRQRLKDPA